MKNRILHICERSTFLENIISNFEIVFPGRNVYLVNSDPKIQFNHKGNFNEASESVKLVQYGTSGYGETLNEAIQESCLLIFHNFGHRYKHKIARQLKGKIHQHAILWGWEIYNDTKLISKSYKARTLAYYRSRKVSIRQKLKDLSQLIIPNQNIVRLNNVTSVSTILKSEYDFLNSNYKISLPYFAYNYSKIAATFNDKSSPIQGKNIAIGNSATYANNHLDLLGLIDTKQLAEDCKVYVPLSYGDDDNYKKLVIQEYKKEIGSKLVVLDTFLPMNEYNSIMLSCGFVIMNHIRQQAMGNIYLSLWNGAKVFLDESSFAFKNLKSDGLKVYKISEFNKEYSSFENPQIITRNREIILATRGQDVSLEHIRKLVVFYQK